MHPVGELMCAFNWRADVCIQLESSSVHSIGELMCAFNWRADVCIQLES